MTFDQKLKLLQLANHLSFFYFLITYTDLYWLLFVSFCVYYLIVSVGVSAGLHRYFTHKSFSTSKFWQNTMLFMSIPATIGTPITWIATHRYHHSMVETEKDPHSPHIIGFIKSYLHLWNEIKIPTFVVNDIVKNKLIKFIHKNYFKILISYILFLYILDPVIGIIIYSIPAVIMFHATGLINSYCHSKGYRTFETKDHSTNNNIIGLLTAGEGFHNNHHHNSSSPNFSTQWHEVDISWYFIKWIKNYD